MAELTKGEVAQRILRLIGINTRFSAASPEEVQDTLQYTEDWLLANNAMGRRLGYIQSSGIPNPAEASGLPDWSIMGVTNSVAIYIAPYFEKQISPSISVNASIGMQTIADETIDIATIQYPNRMALGQGNRTTYGQRYYRKDDRIITDGDYLEDDGSDIITSN